MSRASSRVPVKLHRNVTLIRTNDPIIAEELMSRKSLARMVLSRLTDTLLLVKPDDADDALDELRRMGHTPRVVR
ncbi:hypothetical protein [Aquisphaera insulae]|uniref:hypothetical protein n=1 Tax=Aquisphaera insulae TaxID=2712864 RepID=UPI0013EB4DF1|nr:hypothetical protein [Aquisphaera insulae]